MSAAASSQEPRETPEGTADRVFISYSRDDAAIASRLVGALSDLGVDVWIDEQRIEAGEKWSEAIQRGLDASKLMIVVLSPSSQASENVRDEWQYFLDHEKSLIPVLWEPAKVHFQLSRIQYVDFHERPFDEALVDLCLELEGKGVNVPGFDSDALAAAKRDESDGDTAGRVAAATAARAEAPDAGKPSLLSRPLTWAMGLVVLGLIVAAIMFGPQLATTLQQTTDSEGGAEQQLGAADLEGLSEPPVSGSGQAEGSDAAGDAVGDAVGDASDEPSEASEVADDADDAGTGTGEGGDDDTETGGTDPRVARSSGGMDSAGKDVTRSGHLGGHVKAVVQDGARAYVGVGPSLVVVDLADPAHPLPLGRLNLPALVHAVDVAGDLVLAAAGPAGLRVIDVADPVGPKEMGSLPTDSIVEDVAVSGDHAVIVDSAGLRTVDVSDPQAPVESGLALLPGHASALAVSGDYAFVVTGAGSDALRVVDIGDLASPAEIATVELSGQARDIAVTDSIAVVPTHEGLTIVDVADPAEPTLVAEAALMPAGIVTALGTTVYATDEFGQLRIIDVADAEAPTLLGTAPPVEGGAADISVGGGYAVVADGSNGLHVLRVADPTAPEAVGYYEELSDTRAVAAVAAADDGLVAVANGRHGLALVDVSNTEKPVVLGHAAITPAVDVALIGDHTVAAVGGGDVHVLDVSDPSAPATVASLETLGQARSVAASGSTLVVGDGVGGLRVFDVTDPSEMVVDSVYEAPGDVTSVAVVSSTVYLADVSSSELWVVDISDPKAPVEIARAIVPGISAVGAADDVLCVGDLDGNLQVWDITTPHAPKEIDGTLSGRPVTDILVSGGLAYVTDSAGLHVVDVSDPGGPVEIAYHTTPGSAATGITLSGEDIVVVGGAGGMCLMAHEPSGAPSE